VFAKPPVAGLVKTRLASVLGPAHAANLARAFLQDTWAQVKKLPWAHPILATTQTAPDAPLPTPIETWLQGDGDLGAKLARVLGRALQSFPFAIAIGSDTPGLPQSLLEDAHQALADGAQAVLGPSEDGGFYLIGLRKCSRDLLAGVSWSSKRTYTETLASLRRHHLEPRVLSQWFDVDEMPDLHRISDLIARGEISAPETASVLANLSLIEARKG
jgi:rSAM/selenodomain-associated transferase 1